MPNYKMFEREITSGDHRSYHVCVEKFGNNFNPKSKFYPIDQALSEVKGDFSNSSRFCCILCRHLDYMEIPLLQVISSSQLLKS